MMWEWIKLQFHYYIASLFGEHPRSFVATCQSKICSLIYLFACLYASLSIKTDAPGSEWRNGYSNCSLHFAYVLYLLYKELGEFLTKVQWLIKNVTLIMIYKLFSLKIFTDKFWSWQPIMMLVKQEKRKTKKIKLSRK